MFERRMFKITAFIYDVTQIVTSLLYFMFYMCIVRFMLYFCQKII